DVLADRAVLARVTIERDQLILQDQLRVVEQASAEGRFPVVDRSAGDKSRQALGRVGLRGLGRGRRRGLVGHQKYPSRFFFSMEAASSVSMSRPDRSEVRVISISSMIASRSLARLSIAALSG